MLNRSTHLMVGWARTCRLTLTLQNLALNSNCNTDPNGSWALTVSPQFMGADALATCLACAEIFRRGMWNFFRLENQHLHNCEDFRSISFRMSDLLGSLDKHVDANFFPSDETKEMIVSAAPRRSSPIEPVLPTDEAIVDVSMNGTDHDGTAITQMNMATQDAVSSSRTQSAPGRLQIKSAISTDSEYGAFGEELPPHSQEDQGMDNKTYVVEAKVQQL